MLTAVLPAGGPEVPMMVVVSTDEAGGSWTGSMRVSSSSPCCGSIIGLAGTGLTYDV